MIGRVRRARATGFGAARPPLGAAATAAMALLTTTTLAGAATLERAPYLQSVTSTSAVVVWTTTTAGPAEVTFGDAPDALTRVASGASATQHEIALTNLSPGTRVCYAIATDGAILAGADQAHCFRTAPAAGSRPKLRAWVVGDSGSGSAVQAAVRDAMLGAVGTSPPELFLHMGDMAYTSGKTIELTTNFFAMYPTVLAQTALFPTIGNHEGLSANSGLQTGPYYEAYVLPKAGQAGGLPSGTEAYYAFDWGNVHFVVLDSNGSSRKKDGAMLTWLASDLAANAHEWLVAYWHHPPYTKGSHDSDTEIELIEMRENALPILEAAGVDLVLGGHSHIYERSYLVDGAYATPTVAGGTIKDTGTGSPLDKKPYQKKPGKNAHDGTVYVVAGHGGTGIAGVGNHPLMVKSELANGSCLLDVQENRLAMFNVRVDGAITDRFTLVKGTGLVVTAPDGGERLAPGTTTTLTWATVGTIATVRLELSTDGGQTWTPIAGPIANTGAFVWTVPNIATDRALVRVVDAKLPTQRDESNGTFRIGGPLTVLPLGATWAYHDDGTDPGPTWATLAFDDSAWPTGKAQLGYGDGDEATALTKPTPARPSAYFRQKITLSSPTTAASLRVLHDDGVAVFVNGKQAFSRYADDLSDAAFATASSADNEISNAAIDPSLFVAGTNVIAAIVKQSGPTSSDLSFDLELTITPLANEPGGAGGQGGAAGASAGGGSAGTTAAAGNAGATATGGNAGTGATGGGAGNAGNSTTGGGAGNAGNNATGGSAGNAGNNATGGSAGNAGNNATGGSATGGRGGSGNTAGGGAAGATSGSRGGAAGKASGSGPGAAPTANAEDGCGCRAAGQRTVSDAAIAWLTGITAFAFLRLRRSRPSRQGT